MKAHFSLGSNPFWTLSKSSFDFIDRVFPIVKMVLEYHMDKHGDCDYYYDDDIDHNEFDNDDNDGDDDGDDDGKKEKEKTQTVVYDSKL